MPYAENDTSPKGEPYGAETAAADFQAQTSPQEASTPATSPETAPQEPSPVPEGFRPAQVGDELVPGQQPSPEELQALLQPGGGSSMAQVATDSEMLRRLEGLMQKMDKVPVSLMNLYLSARQQTGYPPEIPVDRLPDYPVEAWQLLRLTV